MSAVDRRVTLDRPLLGPAPTSKTKAAGAAQCSGPSWLKTHCHFLSLRETESLIQPRIVPSRSVLSKITASNFEIRLKCRDQSPWEK